MFTLNNTIKTKEEAKSFAKWGHSSKGHSSKGKSNSVHGVKLSHHKQKLSEKDVI